MKKLSALFLSLLFLMLSGCVKDPANINSVPSGNPIYISAEHSFKRPTSKTADFNFLAADNGYFYTGKNNEMSLFYIKGVNMGLTAAQTDLNDIDLSYNQYYNWLEKIAALNANTVRVFSVMNPNFYNAFYDYNKAHKGNTLKLIQGIWFSENLMYELTDALESDRIIRDAFERSIRETLDIIHGKSDYTVYGSFSPAIYNRDISQYVLGYILGLEYPAEFVAETNASHPDMAKYDGEYLYTAEGASPFEAFLCSAGDYLIKTETEKYRYQTPVAFLNWQTLDVLSHSNEPFWDEEDSVSVNTEHILKKSGYTAGLFAAVDVYPYYPEFMNYQAEYISYKNSAGESDPFAGYLNDLKKAYSVPLLIAEYGLSSSRGAGHEGVTGYRQGELSETEQGNLDTRMTMDIADEGCCGGLLFSWQDEWFKRTWNSVMYYPDNPKLRTRNLSSAEQGYGLLSFDSSKIYPDGSFSDWDGIPEISDTGIAVSYDADYMQLLIKLPKGFDFNKDTLYVPISVTGAGSKKANDYKLEFSSGCDFLLVLNGKSNTRLLCDAYEDVFHYKYAVLRGVFGKEKAVHFKPNSGLYNKIYTYTANEMYLPDDERTIPPKFYESGLLKYGNANPDKKDFNSLSDFCYADGKVEVRIAWYLLNVMNPIVCATIGALNGENIGFKTFSEIYIGAGQNGKIELFNAKFTPVKKAVQKERLKKSYYIMQKCFENIILK